MVSTLAAGSASTLAATRGSLAALIVTVVVLLALGAVFWSFLRRGGAADIAPLAVDQLEAPRVPEPTDPTQKTMFTWMPMIGTAIVRR